MKCKLQTIIGASAASVLAFSAFAQDLPTPKTDQPNYTRGRTHSTQRPYGAAKASEIIGMAVKNYQGEKLGKVEDLAVDVESGRILQVIVSTGGFIGVGDTLTAVPPGALHHDVAHKVLHLDANKEKLKAAAKFELAQWAEHSDSKHLSEVYRYYGEESAFNFIDKEDVVLDDQLKIANESQALLPASRLSQIQQGSKLMGMAVKNRQEEKLGKIENMLVDLSAGRVVAVIISSGGFLGMGDELSAVPPTALRFTTDRTTLQLDASKEMLGNAPHFKGNQWPDFDQPSYADGVYRAYRVAPYFTATTATKADNTGRNVDDRNGRTLTPLDQGKSKTDVATTTMIRKEITAAKNLSVNARNVKIITNNGRVTLRGPVNTAEEKSLIGDTAARVAGASMWTTNWK